MTASSPCRGEFFGTFLLRLRSGPRGRRLFLLGRPFALLDQPPRFAHAVAQVEQLGTPRLAAALHDDLRNERRVQREDALHTFVVYNPADDKRLVDAGAFASQ